MSALPACVCLCNTCVQCLQRSAKEVCLVGTGVTNGCLLSCGFHSTMTVSTVLVLALLFLHFKKTLCKRCPASLCSAHSTSCVLVDDNLTGAVAICKENLSWENASAMLVHGAFHSVIFINMTDVGGPGLYKKAGWAGQREQAGKQSTRLALRPLPAFPSSFSDVLWCVRQNLCSPVCFWSTGPGA